ncbi:MAG: hydrogenase [Nitrospirota bacterium]
MIDNLLILIILTNLFLLGLNRINACIRLVAVQGVLLGILVLVSHFSIHTIIISLGSIILKGWGFPWLLYRTMRGVNIRQKVEPIIGYTMSLIIGVFILIVSFWVGERLLLANSKLLVTVAIFTSMTGLFLTISRRKAINQVLGYLVLENGIFCFGTSLTQHEPLLVEIGVLLDVFVAVFVMGITMFYISEEFDHIDTQHLSSLRDT